MTNTPTIEEWLQAGIAAGFCSPPVCGAHNWFDLLTRAEQEEDEDGADHCVYVVRLHEARS
jgi:hypothetical protein